MFGFTLWNDLEMFVSRRFSTHEQPVILVGILAVDFQLFLQGGQPALDQVDVLQNDPVAELSRLVHRVLGNGLLTLDKQVNSQTQYAVSISSGIARASA